MLEIILGVDECLKKFFKALTFENIITVVAKYMTNYTTQYSLYYLALYCTEVSILLHCYHPQKGRDGGNSCTVSKCLVIKCNKTKSIPSPSGGPPPTHTLIFLKPKYLLKIICQPLCIYITNEVFVCRFLNKTVTF